MNLNSLRPALLKRFKDIAMLLVRHGGAQLLHDSLVSQILRRSGGEGDARDPSQLAGDLEALGPTFIKLGQLLSTRADLLPPPYLEALSRLQDDVEPMPWSQVEEILRGELGASPDEIWAEFERVPLASASIGQVHRARNLDGERLAVKVQRPDISAAMRTDLEALDKIAEVIDQQTDLGRRYAFREMVAHFRSVLLRELDYAAEADNLRQMRQALQGVESIVVPGVFASMTTSKVLAMELIEGRKLQDLDPGAGFPEGADVASDLCCAYLDQILLEGFFHADPHPGNVLLTAEGRLAMIDFGMVARLPRSFRRELLKLVIAVGNGDSVAAAASCLAMGTPLDDFEPNRFEREMGRLILRFGRDGAARLRLGAFVFEMGRIAASGGLRPPAELAVVGKAMMHLDEIGQRLDPEFDVGDVMKNHVRSIAAKQLAEGVNSAQAIAAMIEVREFVHRLPQRLNGLFEALTRRRLEVRVRALDEAALMRTMQQVGTRITLGLVLAACIVGASLIMRIETPYSILGYPALAIVLFLAAFAGGVALLVTLVRQEYLRSKK